MLIDTISKVQLFINSRRVKQDLSSCCKTVTIKFFAIVFLELVLTVVESWKGCAIMIQLMLVMAICILYVHINQYDRFAVPFWGRGEKRHTPLKQIIPGSPLYQPPLLGVCRSWKTHAL
jgi:hypothetical protein